MTRVKRLRPGINKLKYLMGQMRKERAVPRVTVFLLPIKIMGVGVPKLQCYKTWVSSMSAQDQRNRPEMVSNDFLNSGSCRALS